MKAKTLKKSLFLSRSTVTTYVALFSVEGVRENLVVDLFPKKVEENFNDITVSKRFKPSVVLLCLLQAHPRVKLMGTNEAFNVLLSRIHIFVGALNLLSTWLVVSRRDMQCIMWRDDKCESFEWLPL